MTKGVNYLHKIIMLPQPLEDAIYVHYLGLVTKVGKDALRIIFWN